MSVHGCECVRPGVCVHGCECVRPGVCVCMGVNVSGLVYVCAWV